MAVIYNDNIQAPSVDSIFDKSFFDSTKIEPGIYNLSASVTITDPETSQTETYNKWTIICLSSPDGRTPICYTQLWIPFTDSGLATLNSTIFIRSYKGNNSYTGFSKLINSELLADRAVIQKTSYPTEIYIQSNSPGAQSGKTIIWIDSDS